MASYFASHVAGTTGLKYSGKGRRVRCVLTVYSLVLCAIAKTLHRCLEHIINLATQALIKAYSKSQYYNPARPDDDLVAMSGKQRDVIGLVRATVVKVHGIHFTHATLRLCGYNTRHVLQSVNNFSSTSRRRRLPSLSSFSWMSRHDGPRPMSCSTVLTSVRPYGDMSFLCPHVLTLCLLVRGRVRH